MANNKKITFGMIVLLLALSLGAQSCKQQTQVCKKTKSEKTIKDLARQIQELTQQTEQDICDSVCKATGICEKSTKYIDVTAQERIDAADMKLYRLRVEAVTPIRNQYPLTMFFTPKDLERINTNIRSRAAACILVDDMQNIDHGCYKYSCYELLRNPLYPGESIYTLESVMNTLDYLERRPDKSSMRDFMNNITCCTQVPNENPVVQMKQDGRLLFTNQTAQALYNQYLQETNFDDIDQKYILNNPELASRYYECIVAQKKAAELGAKVHKIEECFYQKQQRKKDILWSTALQQLEQGK
ncbi:MAG: hypothetical protein J6T57_04655 [Alphaproteobacteria bacterium]|nr:hypothetical protein [Alphaproteobacteria bacterium]